MNRSIACATMALTITACGPQVVVSTPPARCASLVPAGWSEGVEAAPAPETRGLTDPLAREQAWAGAYVAQDGQLRKANGRTADAIEIFARCEEMVNAARQ